MIGLSVRLDGLNRALAALDRQSGTALKRRVRMGMQAGGKLLVKPIRAEAPRRTGTLARSVSVRTGRDGSVSVGPRSWYRHFVIRGTRRGVTANPFVDRAVDSNLDPAKRRVADVILRGRR